MEQTNVESLLELLRDLFLLYSNFLQEVTSLQKEHNIPDIQRYLSTINAMDFLRGLSLLPSEQLQRVFKVLMDIGTIATIKNPLELSPNDRLTLIERLNIMARELEQVVGVSKTPKYQQTSTGNL
jgi:Mg/Co/Ni transporter MgtE